MKRGDYVQLAYPLSILLSTFSLFLAYFSTVASFVLMVLGFTLLIFAINHKRRKIKRSYYRLEIAAIAIGETLEGSRSFRK